MNAKTSAKPATPPISASTSKLDLLLSQLGRKDGATIDDLTAVTGWQKHSVRGAIAGVLKRKGHDVTSGKVEGVRRYRLEAEA